MKHKSIIPIVLCAVICSVIATGCGDDGTITVNTPTQSVTESTHASDSNVGSTEGTTDNKKPNETNPAASSSTSNSSHEQSSSSSENNSSKNDPHESSKTESSKSDSSQTSKPDKSHSSQTSKPNTPSPKPTQKPTPKPTPKPTEKPAAKPTQHTHTWVNDTKTVTKTVTVTPAKTVTYSRWHYKCNDCGKTWVWDEGVNPNEYDAIGNDIDQHTLNHAYNGGAGSYSTWDETYTKTTPAVTKKVNKTVTTGRHCTTCGKKETY